jgi:hypothetical protein
LRPTAQSAQPPGCGCGEAPDTHCELFPTKGVVQLPVQHLAVESPYWYTEHASEAQHASRQDAALASPAGVELSPEHVPPLATDVLNGGHAVRGLGTVLKRHA